MFRNNSHYLSPYVCSSKPVSIPTGSLFLELAYYTRMTSSDCETRVDAGSVDPGVQMQRV